MKEADIVELISDYEFTKAGFVGVTKAGSRGFIHTTIANGLPSNENPTDCILVVYGDPADFSIKIPLKMVKAVDDVELQEHFDSSLQTHCGQRFLNKLVCVICNTTFSKKMPLCTKCASDAVRDLYANEKFTELGITDEQGSNVFLASLIAHGRFTSVFKGFCSATTKTYAVKIARNTCESPTAAFNNLRDEAEILKQIEHRSIIRFSHFGICADSRAYMLTEFAEGGTVEQSMARLTVEEVITMAVAISKALEALHDKGIIHPMLKLSDIIMQKDEPYAMLADFGAVKVESHPNGTYSVNGIAGACDCLMSPECFLGKNVSAAANVYALGAIVFQCLTGKPIFEGKSFTLITRILNDAPPTLSSARPDLSFDPVLEGTLKACLAKSPSERPTAARLTALFSWVNPKYPSATS